MTLYNHEHSLRKQLRDAQARLQALVDAEKYWQEVGWRASNNLTATWGPQKVEMATIELLKLQLEELGLEGRESKGSEV